MKGNSTNNRITEYETNLSKTYTVTRHKYNSPNIKNESKTKVFSTSDGKVLNRQFLPVDDVPEFQKIPAVNDSNSFDQYLFELWTWKRQFINFSKHATIPVPLSLAIPQLSPPQIISPEEWADFAQKRRLIRNFNAETSPLGPENFIHVAKMLQKGENFSEDDVLPAKGLNDSEILMKYHLNNENPWNSRLIPQRTDPSLYKTFAEYEAAMMRWGEIAQNSDFLPPSPKQVGDIINLKQEDDVIMSAPPPPIEPHTKPQPLTNRPIKEKKISILVRKLKRAYIQNIHNIQNTSSSQKTSQYLNSNDSSSKENSEKSDSTSGKSLIYSSIIPPHAHIENAASVVQHITEYGLPFAPVTGSSLTCMLRVERSMLDTGIMANNIFTKSGHVIFPNRKSPNSNPNSNSNSQTKSQPREKHTNSTNTNSSSSSSQSINDGLYSSTYLHPTIATTDEKLIGKQLTLKKKRDEILKILESNPKELLILDFSPMQFQNVIHLVIPDSNPSKTVGERILEVIPLDEIIKLSTFSDDERFLAKFSVICLYLLRAPAAYDSILQLDLVALEQYVSLIGLTASRSFPLDPMPEEEINEAINDDPQRESQIETLVMDFRQAQLLYTLYSIVFSGNAKFTQFSKFLRNLLHKSYSKIIEIVMSDSLFPKILDGFHSSNVLVHKFYFRLLRTTILLQYTKIIRIFAGHDLLKFMQRGFESSSKEIRRDSHSLWNLMIHSDTSIALQIQLIQASPSSVVNMICNGSKVFRNFLLSIFTLFRETKTMFDFRPLPFAQFQGFFSLFSNDLNNEENILFLYNLLTLCIDSEAIYCFNRKDFVDLINKFAVTTSLSLINNPNIYKMRCLKVLFKIKALEYQSVALPEIWEFILSEMTRKGDLPTEYRLTVWYTFRNAVLKQAHFVSFIRSNESLSKKLDAAFSSFDEKVIVCMIPTLTHLAKPMIKIIGVEEGTKNNLIEFFTHLSDPNVSIAAKLFTAYNASHNSTEIRKMHSYLDQFLLMLIQSEPKSVLRSFMNQNHVKEELIKFLPKVAKLHSLPPPY
ncbi:hypothetical protein TRFO_40315 [Tritrichomonas foetus]|uniref:Uncharacterized protein n=1 Tax=Tritrichomonas foetus TaxID=1144522 RepID=A0A1J4J5G6_9EUKA|nr:hypothetical protein TRFO_40315 [Tritrichomonas foetus]|eukprot:OHS93375.1 hypothetical protein TRFO_40315 [Tritrichomonas foetus]